MVGSAILGGLSITFAAPFVIFSLYLAFIRLQFLNEIESGVFFAILTVLFYILLPVFLGS